MTLFRRRWKPTKLPQQHRHSSCHMQLTMMMRLAESRLALKAMIPIWIPMTRAMVIVITPRMKIKASYSS